MGTGREKTVKGPDSEKFPVNFPVSREFMGRDRFELDCLRHHSPALQVCGLAVLAHGAGCLGPSFIPGTKVLPVSFAAPTAKSLRNIPGLIRRDRFFARRGDTCG